MTVLCASIHRYMLSYFGTIALFTVLADRGLAAAPNFQGLGDLPGGTFSSGASAVSADGSVVVGSSSSGSGSDWEAFRWTASTGMVGLGDLPGSSQNANHRGSWAHSISSDGSVIVGAGTSADSAPIQAFRWTQATGMVGLGYLTSEKYSDGWAVSADGQVVAGSGRSYEAVRWTHSGGIAGLGDLPSNGGSGARGISADGSVIVGGASGQAFRWTLANGMVGLGVLPGPGNTTSASAVSGDGNVVVGWSQSFTGVHEAVLWTEASGIVGLGDLPGGVYGSIAFATNYDGSLVVGTGNRLDDGAGTAFLWDASHGMRSLQDVLIQDYGLGASLTGWTLQSARGITPDGNTIVGFGLDPAGNTEAWIATLSEPSTVPEPSTLVIWSLFGGIGIAVGWWRRRRPK